MQLVVRGEWDCFQGRTESEAGLQVWWRRCDVNVVRGEMVSNEGFGPELPTVESRTVVGVEQGERSAIFACGAMTLQIRHHGRE